MKIKTISATTPAELDQRVNDFEKTCIVRYTQTHVNIYGIDPHLTIYTAIIFYEEKTIVPTLV